MKRNQKDNQSLRNVAHSVAPSTHKSHSAGTAADAIRSGETNTAAKARDSIPLMPAMPAWARYADSRLKQFCAR